MVAKTLTLPFHIGDGAPFKTVIVQARLTNADHSGELGEFDEFFDRGLLHPFAIWMHAYRRPEVVELHSQTMHLWEFFKLGADDQSPIDLRLRHGGTNGIHVLGQFREIQMAMGICEHRKVRCCRAIERMMAKLSCLLSQSLLRLGHQGLQHQTRVVGVLGGAGSFHQVFGPLR